MAQVSNTKIGEPICPICGGNVIHFKYNVHDSWEKNPIFDSGWICTKCGSEFSAEMKGGQIVFIEITAQERMWEINILGNIERGIL